MSQRLRMITLRLFAFSFVAMAVFFTGAVDGKVQASAAGACETQHNADLAYCAATFDNRDLQWCLMFADCNRQADDAYCGCKYAPGTPERQACEIAAGQTWQQHNLFCMSMGGGF